MIASEKIQRQFPWKYLGWVLTTAAVSVQKLHLTTTIATLHDTQKLTGCVQWVRTVAEIRNDVIAPLMSLLKDMDPNTPISLSPGQCDCLDQPSQHRVSSAADRRLSDVPLGIFICNPADAPFVILYQWPAWQKEKEGDGEDCPIGHYPTEDSTGDCAKQKQPWEKLCVQKNQQKSKEQQNQITILEWVFPPHTPPMSIWQRTEVIAHLIRKAQE